MSVKSGGFESGLIVQKTMERKEADERLGSENLAWMRCMSKWVYMLAC